MFTEISTPCSPSLSPAESVRDLEVLGHAVLVVVPELAQVALPETPGNSHAALRPHARRRRGQRRPLLPRLAQRRRLPLVQPTHLGRRLLLLLLLAKIN